MSRQEEHNDVPFTNEKEFDLTQHTPRVFITQEQAHINYAMAESFGDIVFVSAHDVPTVSNSLRTSGIIKSMQVVMSAYVPGRDYILPSGSPLNIAVVMMLAGQKGSAHNILKWESRSESYAKVALEINQ